MKELTVPTSPTKNGANNNRKGNSRSGNRTSPQKDRSPRREKSKSFNNVPSTKSTAQPFQPTSQKLPEMSLESTPSLLSSSSTVDDAMFPYDEEILLTPENILSLKPVSPTKDSKLQTSPMKHAPYVSDEKPILSSEAVDILELLTRKDNVVRLGQAAKKVVDAQIASSAPIEIPEKKKTSSPVPSPSTTIFRSPSPPTRDTNAPLTNTSERFAGPGFCNSPAPQNLPIPAFVDMPVQQPSASRKTKSQTFNGKGVKPTRLNFSPKKEEASPQLQNPRPTHITQHDVTKLLQNTEQAYAVPQPNYLDQLSHQLQSLLNIPVQSC